MREITVARLAFSQQAPQRVTRANAHEMEGRRRISRGKYGAATLLLPRAARFLASTTQNIVVIKAKTAVAAATEQ